VCSRSRKWNRQLREYDAQERVGEWVNVEVTARDPPSRYDGLIDFNIIPIFPNLQLGEAYAFPWRGAISTQNPLW